MSPKQRLSGAPVADANLSATSSGQRSGRSATAMNEEQQKLSHFIRKLSAAIVQVGEGFTKKGKDGFNFWFEAKGRTKSNADRAKGKNLFLVEAPSNPDGRNQLGDKTVLDAVTVTELGGYDPTYMLAEDIYPAFFNGLHQVADISTTQDLGIRFDTSEVLANRGLVVGFDPADGSALTLGQAIDLSINGTRVAPNISSGSRADVSERLLVAEAHMEGYEAAAHKWYEANKDSYNADQQKFFETWLWSLLNNPKSEDSGASGKFYRENEKAISDLVEGEGKKYNVDQINDARTHFFYTLDLRRQLRETDHEKGQELSITKPTEKEKPGGEVDSMVEEANRREDKTPREPGDRARDESFSNLIAEGFDEHEAHALSIEIGLQVEESGIDPYSDTTDADAWSSAWGVNSDFWQASNSFGLDSAQRIRLHAEAILSLPTKDQRDELLLSLPENIRMEVQRTANELHKQRKSKQAGKKQDKHAYTGMPSAQDVRDMAVAERIAVMDNQDQINDAIEAIKDTEQAKRVEQLVNKIRHALGRSAILSEPIADLQASFAKIADVLVQHFGFARSNVREYSFAAMAKLFDAAYGPNNKSGVPSAASTRDQSQQKIAREALNTFFGKDIFTGKRLQQSEIDMVLADLQRQRDWQAEPAGTVNTGNAILDGIAKRMIKLAQQTLGLDMNISVGTWSTLSEMGLQHHERGKLRENKKQHGGSRPAFIARHAHRGFIILPDSGKRQTLKHATMFAHELGHAFIEAHLARLKPSERHTFLQLIRSTLERVTPDVTLEQVKEAGADQFAHWAVGGTRLLGIRPLKAKTLFDRVIDKLHELWQGLSKMLSHEADKSFSDYLDGVAQSYQSGELVGTRYAPRRVRRKVRVGENTFEMFTEPTADTRVFNLTPREVGQRFDEIMDSGSKAWGAVREGKAWDATKKAGKDSWDGGVPARLMRTVRKRIQAISPELHDMLYTASQTLTDSLGWQQRAQIAESRMMGDIDKLVNAFNEKAPRGSESILQKAWANMRAGKADPAGARIKAMLEKWHKEVGKTVPLRLRENFIPEAFDHQQLTERYDEFKTLIQEHFKHLTEGEVGRIIDNMLHGDFISATHVSPGKPVSQHAQVDAFLSNKKFYKAAIDKGFLLNQPQGILVHYARSLASRAAWEQVFGGYVYPKSFDPRSQARVRARMLGAAHVPTYGMNEVDMRAKMEELGLEKEGAYYSPNALFNQQMEKIRKDKGERAYREVIDIMHGVLGFNGHAMPDSVRSSQNWVMTYLNYTMLAFSGLFSTPEMVGGLARGAGYLGARDIAKVLSDFKKLESAVVDLGVANSHLMEQTVMMSMGQGYVAPRSQKAMNFLFRYNGQQWVMKASRALSYGFGKQFIVNTAEKAVRGDKNAMLELQKLHIKPGDVQKWLANNEQGVDSVDTALRQFVLESVITPSRLQQTGWMNNPWFALASHLKPFLYAYMDTMVMGMTRQVGSRYGSMRGDSHGKMVSATYAMLPGLLSVGVIMLIAAGAQELREFIGKSDRTERMSNTDYGSFLVSRAGMLGPLDILLNMNQAAEWGRSPLMAFTPITSRLEQLTGDGSWDNKARLMFPFFSQNKAWWDEIFN